MWLAVSACASILHVSSGFLGMYWLDLGRARRVAPQASEIRRRRLWCSCLGWGAGLLLISSPPALAEDPKAERGPSVVELESGCLSRCASEGRDEAICGRYCDCNLDALGRGLSEEELDRMIRLAASNERGAEQIRAWMRDTAITCRREVFGSD